MHKRHIAVSGRMCVLCPSSTPSVRVLSPRKPTGIGIAPFAASSTSREGPRDTATCLHRAIRMSSDAFAHLWRRERRQERIVELVVELEVEVRLIVDHSRFTPQRSSPAPQALGTRH